MSHIFEGHLLCFKGMKLYCIVLQTLCRISTSSCKSHAIMYNSIILPHNLFISQTSVQGNNRHKADEQLVPCTCLYVNQQQSGYLHNINSK